MAAHQYLQNVTNHDARSMTEIPRSRGSVRQCVLALPLAAALAVAVSGSPSLASNASDPEPASTTAGGSGGSAPGERPSAAHIAKTNAALAELAERAQSEAGRKADAPNAFPVLVDALLAFDRALQSVALPEGQDGAAPPVEPDFRLLRDEALADPASAEFRVSLAAFEACRKSGVDGHLDRIKSLDRFVRPARGTAEHEAFRRLLGAREHGESERWTLLEEADVLRPSLQKLRHYLSASIYRAGRAGDKAELAEAIDRCLGAARLCGADPTLRGPLLRSGAETNCAESIVELLELAWSAPADAPIARLRDAKLLKELAAILDRQVTQPNRLDLWYEYERIQFLDMLPMTYGEGSMALPEPDVVGPLLPDRVQPLLPSRKAELAEAEVFYSKAIRLSAMRFHEARSELLEHDDEALPPKENTPLFKTARPVLKRAILSDHWNRAKVASARTYLAIRMHQLKTGTLPQTLDEVAFTDPSAPTDPFSGKRLGYRVLDKDRFILWSGGTDLQDNGGKFNPDNEEAAAYLWPQSVGFDLQLYPLKWLR